MLPELPTEILDDIFSYLGQGTLRFAVSLACRRWYQIAQAHIRKTVYISIAELSYSHGQGGPLESPFGRMKKRRHLKQFACKLKQNLPSAYSLVYSSGLSPKFGAEYLYPGKEKEIWPILEDALAAATSSLSVSSLVAASNNNNSLADDFNNSGGLRIRKLVLDADMDQSIWSRLMSLLSMLGLGLLSLRIESIPLRSIVPIHEILRPCPNLRSLRIASLTPPTIDQVSRLQEDREEGSNTRTTSIISIIKPGNAPTINNVAIGVKRQWPLQSATFDNLALPLTALESFVQSCPDLIELRIICVQAMTATEAIPGHIGNFIFHKERRDQFFHRLSSSTPPPVLHSSLSVLQPSLYLPKLKSLYVSRTATSAFHLMEEVVPIPQFPKVEHWGFSTMCMAWFFRASACILLDQHIQQFNRLTTLEISGCRDVYNDLVGNTFETWLHRLLCSSPQLEHFKAHKVNFPFRMLYVTKELRMKPWSMSLIFPHDEHYHYQEPEKVWACHKLKTLHITFATTYDSLKGYEEMALVVFGYISRVCPELEDLLIDEGFCLNQHPEYLCLLSRLRRLKRLQLTGFERSTEMQLDWIKRYYHYIPREQIRFYWEHEPNQLRLSTSPPSSPISTRPLQRLWRVIQLLNSMFSSNDSISMSEHIVFRAFAVEEEERAMEKKKKNKEEAEEDGEDGEESDGKEVIDGVDMTYLGKLQDLVNYFQERRSNRDEYLWPELETISFCLRMDYGQGYSSRQTSNLYSIIKKYRSEVKVIFTSAKALQKNYLLEE
ncbi:hypothetical protein BX616_002454 [Lobosporangium transversale]|uniref:F-box domain-containing protein n=1 Tax=Lobosporangium transversale TaxID=64571 RepID=A0A1Y2GVY9_9FUNG|nr:hypothetical protein BCR41DRAFT_419941 [Lobosporangium transversale]KAF9900930.1 hypothetical protein BX616_002454 [Lobosporangium transversale]ORZ26425.1 hypothetical protein BCR41DRAFT_419941 [Lobosporangium transversale]|eukprot:XP_021884190.1 hypothetical protein BCR41DRAFT_419941 [Lobosporangium transversale]